jgi:hypothetical protein
MTATVPDSKFLEPKDVLKDELLVRGYWVTATVTGSMPWPVKPQKVTFNGEELFIIPIMKEHAPGVTMKLKDGMTPEDGQRLIMRFLSAVSWVERQGVLVDYFMGGSRPSLSQLQSKFGLVMCDNFDLPYLPEPSDQKVRLGLALMREGRALNHPAYAFLSFYRVLEVALPHPRKREEWVSAQIDAVKDQRVREVIESIGGDSTAVAVHLRKSSRHAIAHAASDPIINPDDPSDVRRLGSELSLMTTLAERAIEEILGVETTFTVYDKHLYELAGFKRILGPDVVSFLALGEQITDERSVEFPELTVGLRQHEPYAPLSNLRVTEIGQLGSKLMLIMQSHNGNITFRGDLDFAEERLNVSLYGGIRAKDDGSAEGAESMAEISRFLRDYWGNGQLQIVKAESGELVARKDAFIPMNWFLDNDAANAEIERWKEIARQRRARSEAYGRELNALLSHSYNVRVSATVSWTL